MLSIGCSRISRFVKTRADVLVIADTSVLLNLCRVGHDHLLPGLFSEIRIPPAVQSEFLRLAHTHPRFAGLALPGWVKIAPSVFVPTEVLQCPGLDAGETEALALAIEMHADAVLLDEIAARQAAAKLHLTFIGIAGILLRAKVQGLIPALRPVLARLRIEANFWLAPAFEAELLRLGNEGP